jgi:aspartate-semialdehyde dehydrogenase
MIAPEDRSDDDVLIVVPSVNLEALVVVGFVLDNEIV